jgi:hypothetical protein
LLIDLVAAGAGGLDLSGLPKVVGGKKGHFLGVGRGHVKKPALCHPRMVQRKERGGQ